MDKQGYGMTEAGPVLSMSLGFAKEPTPSKSGSCGTVVRNAELKVVHLETRLSLGYNQPGEICIRGQQIMKGSFLIFSVFCSYFLLFWKIIWCNKCFTFNGKTALIEYQFIINR